MNHPTVLVAGEDHNDRQAIRILVSALRPELRGRFEHFRTPMTLVKDLNRAKAAVRADKVVAAMRARQRRGALLGALFHEDCDAPEPDHERKAELIERYYSHAPCRVLAVVPAPMMEAWWLLFPDVLPRVRAAWRAPTEFVGRDVGQLRDAKTELRRALRPRSARTPPSFPDYVESDAPLIAEAIVVSGTVLAHKGQSASWLLFREKVAAL